MPACSLSQMRKLESVASTRHTILSAKARKRRIWEEVILCFVVPLAMLPLLYVVQGHRYQLIESLGPGGVPLFPSWPSIVVAYVTPSLIALVALVYAGNLVSPFIDNRPADEYQCWRFDGSSFDGSSSALSWLPQITI